LPGVARLLAEDWKALANLPVCGGPSKTVPSNRIETVTLSRSRQGQAPSPQAGFTLIELLIAMMIVITLSAIAIPSLMASIYEAKIARAVGDIHAIEDDIAFYQVINGQLPDDLSQAGDGNLLDPWGNPYQYLNHSTMKGNGHARKDRFLVPLNDDYDLYSMGKDGVSSPPLTAKPSQDDIVRAASGGYVGLASQF
jgi:general secretion pathway protein G